MIFELYPDIHYRFEKDPKTLVTKVFLLPEIREWMQETKVFGKFLPGTYRRHLMFKIDDSNQAMLFKLAWL